MHRAQTIEQVGDGKFYTIVFRKANGEVRTINCRTGVTRHLKGGEKYYDDSQHNILTVYDLHKKGYRSIRCDRIIEIRGAL